MKQKKSSQTWISGQINWYDPNSGKGSIIGDDGIWYRIHEFSEIQKGKEKALKESARVAFQLAAHSVKPIVTTVRQDKDLKQPQELKKRRHPNKAESL